MDIDGEFFFEYYEIHFGGCGGLISGYCVSDVKGVALGIKSRKHPTDVFDGT